MTTIQTWLSDNQSNHLNDLDLWLLVAHVTGHNRAWVYAYLDQNLTADQLTALNQYHQQLSDGQPLAYLTGHKAFWNLSLKVTPATLIPRPDTELLVEQALQTTPLPERVLDLGTGSGAIALALASEWPQAEIHATDLSSAALAVARDNGISNGLTQVQWHQSDWYENLPDGLFDLIVSNPPYIHPDDPHLLKLKHEPISALAADDSGLADIKQIAEEAMSHLNAGGNLMIEHGWDQKTDVQTIFKQHGFSDIVTHKDLAGHDRVTQGSMKT